MFVEMQGQKWSCIFCVFLALISRQQWYLIKTFHFGSLLRRASLVLFDAQGDFFLHVQLD
ncbi:MAG: hypothetical protein CVU54_09910 [Deltaproteobacteria bacterium HGW-Deltaproteobacteria-12]|nr:MAG: hypothetical protein CVU54_09910 [Deltaproteobacteria bacterium HGW-Deltaproteobacteria-12]